MVSWRTSCVNSVEKKLSFLADGVETLGVDQRTKVKRLGAKQKARRKKCSVRFSFLKENKSFQKNCMKVGVKKMLRGGMKLERFKLRRQMAAAAGKKEYDLPVFVHGNIRPRSGRRALHHGYSVLGRRSMDKKMELRAKRSLDEADSRGSNVEASERARRSSDA